MCDEPPCKTMWKSPSSSGLTSVTLAKAVKTCRSNGSRVSGRDAGARRVTRYRIVTSFAGRSVGRSFRVLMFQRSTPQAAIDVGCACGERVNSASAEADATKRTTARNLSFGRTVRYVTTNDVRSDPAAPQEIAIGQRPGVVRVPTFHVQLTRPATEDFGQRPAAMRRPGLVVDDDRWNAARRDRDGQRRVRA